MTATTERGCITFDAASHRYTLDGAEVPSITTVLSVVGLSGSPWFTEAARNRGTAVHQIATVIAKRAIRGTTAEEIVANSLWDPRPPALGRKGTAPVLVPYGYALASFLADSGFRPELVECPVASARFRVAGTLDAYGKLPDGRRLLVDWKSGAPQQAAGPQTAGYAALLEECHGLKTDIRTVVWLRPDGSYKQWPYRPAGGQDLAVMQSAINIYHWRVANKMV